MRTRTYTSPLTIFLACLIGFLPCDVPPVWAAATVSRAPTATVEMVFVLDTTGSMGGMIEGAKQKIWGIVNAVLRAPNPPRVRVGLVAYRDHGDTYVTKVLPITGDLDRVYATLKTYRADGGGDTPEDVRQSLADGVHRAGWAPRAPGLVQTLFLVGDAPPHDDYTSEPDTCTSAHEAAHNGIRVDTIQCGSDPNTARAWERIRHCGEGEFFSVPEDGGVQVTPPTPLDPALGDLGLVLGGTFIPYGGVPGPAGDARRAASLAHQKALEASLAHSSPAGALADRAINKALNRDAYPVDLLQMLHDGVLKLDTLDPALLPAPLRRLSPADRTQAITTALTNRESVRQEVLALSRARDAYLGRSAPATPANEPKGLDTAVIEALRRQAAGQGISF